jgi:prevent-host-death family protein
MSSALSSHAHVTVVTPTGETVEAPRVYTMTELNQQTARVLEEVNEAGRPAVITRHGRFVAMLSPLAAGQVESTALSRGPVAEELRRRQAAESEPSLSADDLESRMDTWS